MTNQPNSRIDPLSAWLCLVAATAIMASPRFDCSNAFGDMGRYVCGGARFAVLDRTLANYSGTDVRHADCGNREEVGADLRRGQTRVLDDNLRSPVKRGREARYKRSCIDGTEGP
jgi:hypothetical protein